MDQIIIAKLIILLQMLIALIGSSTPMTEIATPDTVATSTPSLDIGAPALAPGDLPQTNASSYMGDVPVTSPTVTDVCHISITVGGQTVTKKTCSN